jgi:hypothetical protein
VHNVTCFNAVSEETGVPALWLGIVVTSTKKTVRVQWVEETSGKYRLSKTVETNKISKKSICGELTQLEFKDGMLISLFPHEELTAIKLGLAPSKVRDGADSDKPRRVYLDVHTVAGEENEQPVLWFGVTSNKKKGNVKGKDFSSMQWLKAGAGKANSLFLFNQDDIIAKGSIMDTFAKVAFLQYEDRTVMEIPFTSNQLQESRSAMSTYHEAARKEQARTDEAKAVKAAAASQAKAAIPNCQNNSKKRIHASDAKVQRRVRSIRNATPSSTPQNTNVEFGSSQAEWHKQNPGKTMPKKVYWNLYESQQVS